MILAALLGQDVGQLIVATKIACSQTLYFLFKVHRARMIKNKNVFEKNEKKKNRTTSVYRLLRKCEAFEFGFVFNNHESFTKVRKQHESLHESTSWDPRPSPFPFSCRLISYQCKMAAVLAFTGINPTSTHLTQTRPQTQQ